ncbi:MAG: hypothetical protein JRD89_20375 [Deltaproteobacteria bacterium]|nr:hypothetical protein [Deltaproteobacteria bacterium]
MSDQELWDRAMRLLQVKGIRRRARADEAKLIAEMSYDFHPAVRYQMERDLKVYPLFDAVAMWVQPKVGLAEHEPQIIPIAKILIEQAEKEA